MNEKGSEQDQGRELGIGLDTNRVEEKMRALSGQGKEGKAD